MDLRPTVASLGREWQLGTVQLDVQMPRRLGCRYARAGWARPVPAVIHLALLGSFERFLAVLLGHTDGRLPAFMAPVQLRLVPMAARHEAAARRLADSPRDEGFRVEAAGAGERVAAQVRDARLRRVPLVGVIGDRELADGTVAVSEGSGTDLGLESPAALAALLRERCLPPEV